VKLVAARKKALKLGWILSGSGIRTAVFERNKNRINAVKWEWEWEWEGMESDETGWWSWNQTSEQNGRKQTEETLKWTPTTIG
jgi:hypothetical protein